MHDLFHYYCLVLPELPYLRKMQGKTPFDTPWKTPLPRHEKQPSVPAFGRTSSTSSALKGEGMQHHKGKKESLPAGLLMSSPPQRHTWKLPHGICRPCVSHSWLARPSFGTQSPEAGGSSGAVQWHLCSRRNVKVCCGGMLTAVSSSVSQDLLLSFH